MPIWFLPSSLCRVKDTIYLVITNSGVDRMTKRMPATSRGEHLIKLAVTVDPKAFRDPVLTQEIVIEDWREGLEFSDVAFEQPFISPAEADVIRERRRQQLIEALRSQGYEVTRKDAKP